ncbi:MAG: hypothetical protein R3B47_00260 [Bacteroidia bacterium]
MHKLAILLLFLSQLLFSQSIPPSDIAAAEQARSQNLDQLSHAELLKRGFWEELEGKMPIRAQAQQLGNKDRQLAARYWILQNEFEKAENMLDGLSPLEPEVKLLRARLYIEAWELDSANTMLRAVENQLPEARFWLGRLQLLQKNYSTALPYARELRSRDHEPALGYLLEAEAQLWLRNLPAAEEALERSLELDPFNADARFWYGYVIWRKVDASLLPAMAAQWDFALKLNPLHYLTHWHWGNGHTHLSFEDYYDKDEEAIREALRTAEQQASSGNLEQALALGEDVQKRFPESVVPALYRASWWYLAFDEKDHLNASQAIFEDILAKKAHYGPAHNGLAAVIKAKRFRYLSAYNFLNTNLPPLPEDEAEVDRFFSIFPDMAYYPGDRVQRMIYQQLHEGKAYFPLLEKLGRKFVIPPLHIDLALAMQNNWFRRGVTFDNRQWMDIRGVGSGATGIEYVMRGAYLERNVTLHEYVHLFHGYCFSDREKRRIRQLYARAMQNDLTLDYYAANNEHEYLAQTYTAYFSYKKVHPLNHKSVNTRFDLASKDPELYAWIDSLVQKQRAFMAGDDSVFAENWAAVYLSLAEKNQRAGNLDATLALVDTALQWAPDYAPALAKSIELMRKKGDEQAAFDKLKMVVQKLGQQPVFLREAAIFGRFDLDPKPIKASELKGEDDAYIFWLKKAWEKESDFSEKAVLQEELRKALLERLRWKEAIALSREYANGLDAFSTYLRDRQREALAFAHALTCRQGDIKSLLWLDSTLGQRPQDEELLLATADAHRDLGQYEQAIEILKTGLSLLEASGGKGETYIRKIALCNALNGEADLAQKLLGRVQKVTENQELVRALIAAGQLEAAEKIWHKLPEEKALARAEKAWLRVTLLEAKGERGEARKALKEAQASGLDRGWL